MNEHHAAHADEPRPSDAIGAKVGASWLFATFRVSSSHPTVFDGRDVPGAVRELEDVVDVVAGEGVQVRGWYDITGFRSDADVMVWLTGNAPEDLQWAYRQLRRTGILRPLVRTSSEIVTAASTPGGDAGSWLAVVAAAAAGRGGTPANDISTGQTIELLEHDSADELFGVLSRGVGAPRHVGRLIAPVELVEVLQ